MSLYLDTFCNWSSWLLCCWANQWYFFWEWMMLLELLIITSNLETALSYDESTVTNPQHLHTSLSVWVLDSWFLHRGHCFISQYLLIITILQLLFVIYNSSTITACSQYSIAHNYRLYPVFLNQFYTNKLMSYNLMTRWQQSHFISSSIFCYHSH